MGSGDTNPRARSSQSVDDLFTWISFALFASTACRFCSSCCFTIITCCSADWLCKVHCSKLLIFERFGMLAIPAAGPFQVSEMEFRKLLRDDGEEAGARRLPRADGEEAVATGAEKRRTERLFPAGDDSSMLLDFAGDSTFTSEPSSSGGATCVKDLRSSKALSRADFLPGGGSGIDPLLAVDKLGFRCGLALLCSSAFTLLTGTAVGLSEVRSVSSRLPCPASLSSHEAVRTTYLRCTSSTMCETKLLRCFELFASCFRIRLPIPICGMSPEKNAPNPVDFCSSSCNHAVRMLWSSARNWPKFKPALRTASGMPNLSSRASMALCKPCASTARSHFSNCLREERPPGVPCHHALMETSKPAAWQTVCRSSSLRGAFPELGNFAGDLGVACMP